MNTEDKFAHIAKLVELGELKEGDMVGGKKVGQFFDENPGVVARFGQVQLSKDVDKAIGSNKQMREASAGGTVISPEAMKQADVVIKMPDGSDEQKEALKQLTTEAKMFFETVAFVKKMDKTKDPGKMNVNSIFNEETEKSKALMTAIDQYAPQLWNGIVSRANSRTIDNIRRMNEQILKPRKNAARAEALEKDKPRRDAAETAIREKYQAEKEAAQRKFDQTRTRDEIDWQTNQQRLQQELERFSAEDRERLQLSSGFNPVMLDDFDQKRASLARELANIEQKLDASTKDRKKNLDREISNIDLKITTELNSEFAKYDQGISKDIEDALGGKGVLDKILANNVLFGTPETATQAQAPTPPPTPGPTP